MTTTIKNTRSCGHGRFLKYALICIFSVLHLSCSDSFKEYIAQENLASDKSNNNIKPTISFTSSASNIINEDGTEHLINIILSTESKKSISVTVTDLHTGTAVEGQDYSLSGWTSPEVITFSPGETMKTIGITPIQEQYVESEDKTINIELSSPVNAELGISSHTVTILDDDVLPTVSFSASTSVIPNEDEIAHEISITLSKTSDVIITITISDSVTGTALFGTDYTLTGWTSPDVTTFNPGETLKIISVTPIQDLLDEDNETINLELSSPINAVLGNSSHAVTILDDDVMPIVSFSTSTSVVSNENEVAHNINIALSSSYGETVTVTATDLGTGSASFGTDYTRTGWTSPQVITFNPGDTLKTISITPIQDILDEDNETINLELSSPVNASIGTSSHVVTITDDDGWVKLSDVATARAGAATAVYNGWLYIYGGENSSEAGVLNDFWRYNLATDTYEILTTSGSGGYRAYATLVELNGKLYRFGGKDETGTLHDDNKIYYYDIASGLWGVLTGSDTQGTWPDVRYSHVSVAIYDPAHSINKLYFEGGKDSGGNNVDGACCVLDFNNSKPKWDQIGLSTYKRSEHSAVAVNNNAIYFFGGYNSLYFNDLWKYDLVTGSFIEKITTGITIIPKRSGIQMIEDNGNLYVYGGRNASNVFDDLWTYSTGANKWTKISTAPFKRCFHTAVKYNNALLIYGGYYLNTSGQKIYSSELWQYSLTGE